LPSRRATRHALDVSAAKSSWFPLSRGRARLQTEGVMVLQAGLAPLNLPIAPTLRPLLRWPPCAGLKVGARLTALVVGADELRHGAPPSRSSCARSDARIDFGSHHARLRCALHSLPSTAANCGPPRPRRSSPIQRARPVRQ